MQLPPPIHGASVINEYIKESSAINNAFNSKFLNITTADDLSSIGFFSIKKIFKTLSLTIACLKNIWQYSPRLIYITLSPVGLGFVKDSLLVIVAKLLNKKIVIHIHGRGIVQAASKSWIVRKYYKLIFNNTYIIVLSKKLLKDIPTYFKTKKFFILNNCIKEIKKYVVTNSKPLQNGTLQLLFLSNLVKEKGILEYLEVCKILHQQGIPFIAHIIGKPFDVTGKDIQDYIVKHNIEQQVVYHGSLYGEEKSDILNKADILIFPTKFRNEAFPLVILEAFKYGVVPLSVNIGGIADIIENNKTGFCFDDNKPEYFVETIKLLHQNRALLNNIANNCINEFKSKYTIDKFEANFIHIMNEVYKLAYE